MAKVWVKLVFPPKLIKQPVTFQMAMKYKVIPNIRRAKVTTTVGEIVMEITGAPKALEQGLKFLKKKGVMIEPIVGDVLE
jgi:hypothetical protein